MKAEDKELLRKEFCARLPYGIRYNYDDCIGCDYVARTLDAVAQSVDEFPIWDCKLYLRPMSSMTEAERKELNKYIFSEKGLRYFWFNNGILYNGPDHECFIGLGNDTIDRMIDWLNAHHFDYRGLIEMELAKVAPKGMYD